MATIIERRWNEPIAGQRDRIAQWGTGSAFEQGLRQLIREGTSDGLKEATGSIQNLVGKGQPFSRDHLAFPSHTDILHTIRTGAAFTHSIPMGEASALHLIMQCYPDAPSLVMHLLRDGQRIDMTGYIHHTVDYYEIHGSPHLESQQRAQLMSSCFPAAITPDDDVAPFVLLGDDVWGSSRLGTHTRMFQEELAQVDKFRPPYFRLRLVLLSSSGVSNPGIEQVRETLEDMPLFHAGIVLAGGNLK